MIPPGVNPGLFVFRAPIFKRLNYILTPSICSALELPAIPHHSLALFSSDTIEQKNEKISKGNFSLYLDVFLILF
jgi:hypothetical protein